MKPTILTAEARASLRASHSHWVKPESNSSRGQRADSEAILLLLDEIDRLRAVLEHQERAWQWFRTGCHFADERGMHKLAGHPEVTKTAEKHQAEIREALK